jgi:hypothetical protein
LLAAKLSGGMAARVLHQESGLDRLLSLVSAGYGILLMLKGGTGVRQEGVVFRAAIGYTAADKREGARRRQAPRAVVAVGASVRGSG